MIIKEKIGNINSFEINNRVIDWLNLEWYETNKRILHKKTTAGREVVMRFLKENQNLSLGDVVFEDDSKIIAIDIIECDVMVIRPETMFAMASICYEIGNKHLPLFFDNNELLVPFEMPLFRLLSAQGYFIKKDKRKLVQPLKTTVTPHGQTSESLFSKIMKLTTSNE